MAISYTPTDIRGKAYEPVIEEILFANDTVEKNLVAFETDVKSDTIFTENDNTATMQAYTSGAPSSSGTLGLTDTLVSPVKVMYYQEFDPNTLRSSRFKRDMAAGAWNVESNEFASKVLGSYGKLISEDLQAKFWSNATSATKTAVAAGANTTAEKAYVAGLSAGQFDGVVTRMIYNGGAVGGRINVVGVSITSSTIATEYGRAYAAVPARVLFGAVKPYIYAPYSHKQLINIFNINSTYRDLFSVQADGRYFYNGVEIVFVPLPENCIIVARPDYIVWCTDLLSDINMLKIDKIALNREDMFVKNIMTIFAHVLNQSMNVLYL
jgi:hypothetical protein